MVSNLNIKEKYIVLFGRSLGSGPAVHLARKYNPSGLVLMSPFCSIKEAAKKFVGKFFTILVKERFNNKEKIAETKCPLLVMHGKLDEVIPYE